MKIINRKKLKDIIINNPDMIIDIILKEFYDSGLPASKVNLINILFDGAVKVYKGSMQSIFEKKVREKQKPISGYICLSCGESNITKKCKYCNSTKNKSIEVYKCKQNGNIFYIPEVLIGD